MISRLVGLLTILATLLGGLLLYANTAYFPMGDGRALAEKVADQEKSINSKLDILIQMAGRTK